jgi:drug/metabolite transporter (DMT)-like permease
VKSLDATGAALCVLGMTILGGSVSVSRAILDYPALTGQTLRYALAAAILAVLVRGTRRGMSRGTRRGLRGSFAAQPATAHEMITVTRQRPTPREFAVLVALTATGLVAFNVLLLAALRHADAPVVGTVIGAAPLGLALLGPLLRGARPAARLVGAACVVVAGTALVHGGGHADALGVLAALGAFAGEVAFSLLAAVVLPSLGALRVSAWSCALAVPLLLLAALATGEPARWRAPTAAEAAALAFLAVLLTVGAFLAWFTGLQRLGVERAGMFVGLLPVSTLVATAIQDARLPDPVQTVGVLVVAAGLTLGLLARPRPASARVTSDDQGMYRSDAGVSRGRSLDHAGEAGRSAARTASA